MTAPVPVVRDRSGEGDETFGRELARLEAAPVAGESAATVERVARAMWEATSRDRGWRSWDTLHAVMRDPYYRLALAAITALETPDAAAVRRVLALADSLEAEAAVIAAHARVPVADFVKFWRDDAPGRIRAALAGGGRP